ncbi:pyocin knob domain-containing protein [Pasteurella multocida]|uniref:pyocin knob domain-containing protein n=1 Tax=Pasteurella multocida TaxID=747 RepID=UPI002B5F88B1|nr:pyocin knob domain-containing protein [Pasteurella multocida]MEB3501771.1 pyocin knob domain-containing protein [Pasteurella multocida]MEE3748224.1 pyocin knob domain-containing protein [Pasteurella multocida]
MADFNKPTVDSNYTQFPNEIRAAISAALSFLDGGTHTNIPMKAKRWNPTSKIFEEYSGTKWVPMATEYKLPVDYNVLRNKPVPSSATNSDSETQFASSKAVKTVYDLASGKQSPATTLSGYGINNFKIETSNGNANNYKTDGNYYFPNGQNLPGSGAWHIEVVSGGSSNAVRQIARKANDSEVKERFFNGASWSAWKKTGSDGVPVGSIVAFRKGITQSGYLMATGGTFNQATYPDLYIANGNSNVLPNLTRSDVGMTAYFATDAIPDGWISFDSIRTTVTQQNYPELYQYLVDKYGSIAQVPLVEDRFIRNSGNGLNVGETQDDAIRNITGQFTIDDYDRDKITGAFKMVGNGHAAGNSGGGTLVEFNASLVVPTADENRPKSIILKLCIKAKNSFDDVVFWIKAFGEVANTGTLDAGTLAQDLQQTKSKTQQLEALFNQNKTETALKIQQIEGKLTEVNQVSRIVWSGNVTQNSANVLELSESILNKTLIFYLQVSQGHSLQQNVDTNTMSVFVDEKLLEVNGRKYIHFVFYLGGWKSVQIEIIEDRKIKIIEASNMYIKQITAI